LKAALWGRDQSYRHRRGAVNRLRACAVAAPGDIHYGNVYLSVSAVDAVNKDLQETYDRDRGRPGWVNRDAVVIDGQGNDGRAAGNLAVLRYAGCGQRAVAPGLDLKRIRVRRGRRIEIILAVSGRVG